MTDRDPFADDVLERLARSNMDYQRTHGNYIVPLAERLLDARARLAEAERLLEVGRETIRSWADALDVIEDALAALREKPLPDDPNTRAWLGIEPQFPEEET